MATFEALRHQGIPCRTALDQVGCTRMCCRRMLITYPSSLESSLLSYPAVDRNDEALFLDVRQKVDEKRTLGCS